MPVTVVSRRTLACGLALLPGLLAVPGGARAQGARSAVSVATPLTAGAVGAARLTDMIRSGSLNSWSGVKCIS